MREPGMTRRHFELIAHVINALNLNAFGCHAEPAEIRLEIAHDFARVMEGVNQSFNREAFINACTMADRKRAEGRAKKLTKRAATGGAKIQNYNPDDKLPESAAPGGPSVFSSGMSNACDQDEGA